MARDTRPISWIAACRKAFETFPDGARLQIERALTVAAEGRKADLAKPMKGLGVGVLEIALRFRGDAYRVIYALQLGEAVWVVHAFKKKARSGRKTPNQEIELVRQQIRRLRELLR